MNLALMILLIGQPKVNLIGCRQITDMLITIAVKDVENGGKPSADIHQIKLWDEGCKRHWRKED